MFLFEYIFIILYCILRVNVIFIFNVNNEIIKHKKIIIYRSPNQEKIKNKPIRNNRIR